jgi:hypothetical protein
MSDFPLDEALRKIKDETAVNQQVDSLEKLLEQQSGFVQYRNGKSDSKEPLTGIMTTSVNSSSTNNGAR